MRDNEYYKKIGIKIIVLLVCLLGIFLTYKLAMFYLPFIIAIFVSTCIEPLVKIFNKKLKLNRKLSCIISLLLIITIFGGIIGFGITKIVLESKNLIENSNEYFSDMYNNSMEMINKVEQGNTILPKESVDILKESTSGIIDALKGIAINFGKVVLSSITSIPTVITYIVITVLAIIFTCLDRQYVINKIKSQVPKKWYEKVVQIWNEMCSVTWNYVKAETKLSFICFILVCIGLAIMDIVGLDIKFPALMAVIIGFVDLLPLFGAGTVMLPWAAYLVFTGNIPLAVAIISLWGVWAILKQFIEPKMVSKQIGMHPVFTLLGMYTGFRLMGVLGLMIGPIVFLIIGNIFNELLKKGVLKSFFELD